jgi:peptidoglycan/LPS O-acetylase OafA/YrhL
MAENPPIPGVSDPRMRSAGSNSTGLVVPSPIGAGTGYRLSRPHLPLLDGLRGLAILMVLMLHVGHISASPIGIDRLVRKIATTGWMGVDLFFVLSGFLITGILLDAKTNSKNYFRNFYMRRVLRIFPLNYAFLILLLIILPQIVPAYSASLGNPPSFTWPYWMFLSNFADIVGSNQSVPLTALWSLAIEEQFYLVWPAIILVLQPRTLGRLCVALAIISPVIREVMVLRGFTFDVLTTFTFSHMDPIVLGSYLAVAARTGGLRRFVPAAWILTAILPVLLLAIGITSGALTNSRVFLVFGFSMVGLLFAAMMVLILEGARVMRIFNMSWLRWIGRRSYSIYLFNQLVIYFLSYLGFDPDKTVAPGHTALPQVALFFVLTLIGCVLVAWVSWNLFEKYFLRMKSLFPMSPEFRPPASVLAQAL